MGFVLVLEVFRKIKPSSREDVRFLLKDFVRSPLGAHVVLTSASICTSASVSAAEEHPAAMDSESPCAESTACDTWRVYNSLEFYD